MRVVVTGGCGFIGSHLCEALLARGDQVVVIDNFNDAYEPTIKRGHASLLGAHANATVHDANIHDDSVWSSLLSCADVVVHLAAWAGVRRSLREPARYQHENVAGTQAVVAAMHRWSPTARLVFASSSSIYGARDRVPFHEEDPLAPAASPYAATKQATEAVVAQACASSSLQAVGLRFFTVYGPRQRPDMAIASFASSLLAGQPLQRFGDGNSARDYTFIDDIIAGTLAAIDRGASLPAYRVYNLGNETTTTLTALMTQLAEALEVPLQITPAPTQDGDVPLTCASIARARDELGYQPTTSIRAGLAHYAAWLRRPGVANS
jgi:UDP-glucuronate 4-epimerase